MARKPFAVNHDLASADVNDLTGVYIRTPTALDLVSSTSPTVIYEPTIAGGHMSTDRMFRMTLGGDILQNATAALTLAIRTGTGTIWQATVNIGNDADRAAWRMVIEYMSINSANVQRLGGHFVISDRTPPTAGQGSDGQTTVFSLPFAANDTANTASACSVGLIATWSVNSANASFRRLYAIAELL